MLRRRAGESIVIGGNIEIDLLEICSQSVKIGIRAPKEISILRKELEVVQAQNRSAAQPVNLERIVQSLENFKIVSRSAVLPR